MTYAIKINGKVNPDTIKTINDIADVGEVISNFRLIYVEADEDQIQKIKGLEFVEDVTQIR
jgi:flagellar basal body L-ring protein FlgH